MSLSVEILATALPRLSVAREFIIFVEMAQHRKKKRNSNIDNQEQQQKEMARQDSFHAKWPAFAPFAVSRTDISL